MTTATRALPDRDWLTPLEVCAALGCSRRTLDGMRQRQELFARPHGNGSLHRTWRYRRLDVLRLAGLATETDVPAATQESERARVAAYHRLVARLHRQLALANDELARALSGDDAAKPERADA